jgi:signal transduction histidine kinase
VRSSRYAPEIEGAAYFVVAEGLANVLKHAGADQATVTLSVVNSHLSVEVADDGHGFIAANSPESGLRGLRDRVEALGGRMGIDSRPDGTRLQASLPARERVHA